MEEDNASLEEPLTPAIINFEVSGKPESHIYSAWQNIISLIGLSRDSSLEWRNLRNNFAQSLANEMAGFATDPYHIDGHVVYGIWLDFGLVYVGQSADTPRRLKDIPIGESHHLANTFPPEIWKRIIIVSWENFSSVNDVYKFLTPEQISLSLEFLLQKTYRPLHNSVKRTSKGTGLKLKNLDSTTSDAAKNSVYIEELFADVREVWDTAAHTFGPDTICAPTHRIVFPQKFSYLYMK